MYPPSSPHLSHHTQQYNQAPMFRAPTSHLPSPPSNGRSTPGLPPAPSSASSMSISSMLDGDTPRPSHASHTSVNKTVPLKALTVPSPKWQSVSTTAATPPHPGHRTGFVYSKSQSPEKLKVSPARISDSLGSYSGGAQRRSLSTVLGELREDNRPGISPRPFVSQFSPISDIGPWQDSMTSHDKYPSTGRPVERRNSQPSPYSAPTPLQEDMTSARPATSETAGFPPPNRDILKALGGTRIQESRSKKQHALRAENAPAPTSDNQAQYSRDGPPKAVHPATQTQDVPNTTSYPFLTRTPNSAESQRPRKQAKTESSIHRVLEREQATQSPYTDEHFRRLRSERLASNLISSNPRFYTNRMPIDCPRPAETYSSSKRPVDHPVERLVERPVERPIERAIERPIERPIELAIERPIDCPIERPIEQNGDPQGQTNSRNQHLKVPTIDGSGSANNPDPPAKSEEDDPRSQRGSLAHILGDRRGRASPLPQAVQGAQDRMTGPASDPGIKSEFARMFSGIGAGAGGNSGRIGSGASSPYPQSPTRNVDPERRTPLSGRGDLGELAKISASSRGGRKIQKPKEEESKQGHDESDGRNILAISNARGVKRNRHSHHHHHHHPHAHHHHHHHHEEPVGAPGASGANVTTLKRVSTPSQQVSDGVVAVPHHHHHHHHRHHRHHHHNLKVPVTPPVLAAVPEPVVPLRVPVVRVDSKRILESVQKYTRHHLGSTLYRPSEMQAPFFFQSSKQGTDSTPKQLPRFEGKENCTITIRIPRFYLKGGEREKICSRRAIWGVDIYTDDSDPLAAAIHSGWIKGKWPAGIGASMLELKTNTSIKRPSTSTDRIKTTKSSAAIAAAASSINDIPSELIHTSPPPSPLTPMPGKDLHLTLLILPTLQTYPTLTRHGIKSRSLLRPHSGMSFQIAKLVWIDGGAGNGEERGGEARRKRMRTALAGLELRNTLNVSANSSDGGGAARVMALGPPVRLNMIGGMNMNMMDRAQGRDAGMLSTAVQG